MSAAVTSPLRLRLRKWVCGDEEPHELREGRGEAALAPFEVGHELSPGNLPITFTRRRVSPKVHSMKFE
jgi:hypothetical protein